MTMSRAVCSIFLTSSMAVVITAAKATQCVSVSLPAFNLTVDEVCKIKSSSLVKSVLPDQQFLGYPGTCFTIVDPTTSKPEVAGTVKIGEKTVPIEISGIVGLTSNNYGTLSIDGNLSFTAVTQVSFRVRGKEIGKLVTRDAGTFFSDGNIAARLSVVSGTRLFSSPKVTGYIDEVGQEFNPFQPASAAGILCGINFEKSIDNDDDGDDD